MVKCLNTVIMSEVCIPMCNILVLNYSVFAHVIHFIQIKN